MISLAQHGELLDLLDRARIIRDSVPFGPQRSTMNVGIDRLAVAASQLATIGAEQWTDAGDTRQCESSVGAGPRPEFKKSPAGRQPGPDLFLRMMVDPSMPDGVAAFVSNGKVLGVITGLDKAQG